MPLVIDHRSFLKRTGAGALLSIASHWSFADTPATTRVALLSDTHIAANAFDTFRGFYPHRNLQRRREVKAVIFGHRHVYTLDQIDGIHLVNLPAVGYSFADGNPVG